MAEQPDYQIDNNTIYRATITTDRGSIVMDLDPQLAPTSVNNFVALARQGYYDGLLRVTLEGDHLAWIGFFVDVVVESANETLDRLQRLRGVREDFAGRLHKVQSAKPALLVAELFGLPYLTVPMARAVLEVESATAQQNINKLVAAGILELMDERPIVGRGRPPKPRSTGSPAWS